MALGDRISRPVKVLFVGINPGIRSEAIGHHFAGYSNRFWKLLFDARPSPRRSVPKTTRGCRNGDSASRT